MFLRSVRLSAATSDIAAQYKREGAGDDKEKNFEP
jgi:hypothetical protein